MAYSLTLISLTLLMLITETNELSVDISPIPAEANVGANLLVTSTITKSGDESWTSLAFHINNRVGDSVCYGAWYITDKGCSDGFGCPFGFGFTCDYNQFNLLINDVNSTLLNWTIYAEITYGNDLAERSATTRIAVLLPLEGVSLTPHGEITMSESQTKVFTCSAKSLPKPNLSWNLNGSILPTQSPPVETPDTATSTYSYTAKKNDNGKKLSCTAVSGTTTVTEYALINVNYKPKVAVSPNHNPYYVLENTTNLQLTCIVTDTNPPVTSFTWKKGDTNVSAMAIFEILNVKRSHTGSYACGATNSVGISDPLAGIQLEVLYGVDLITISKKEPIEGTSLRITCSGKSYPAVTDNDVTWSKQNNDTFIMRGKQLVINNVNRLDSGTFVCSVHITLNPTVGQPFNVTGRTSVEVDSLYPPDVTISPNYEQCDVIENTTNLVLNCTVVDANPAVLSTRWYKDGVLIDDSTGASYTISLVLRSHKGRYSCDATNSVGSSIRSPAVQLRILYGIDIDPISKTEPTELANLLVFCSVNSFPKVANNGITWTKLNNATFMRKNQQLNIEHIKRIDSGIYVCTAVLTLTPTLGQSVNVTGSTTFEVNVLYRPTVTIDPSHTQYNVIENTTNLQLTCKVMDANPNVTSYTWYKDSSAIFYNAMYTIPTVQKIHTGSYTCVATNSISMSIPSPAVQLNVMYGVNLYPISKTGKTEGEQLTVTCSGQSYPMMTNKNVKWSKKNNNTFMREGIRLVIDNVNRLDSGTYICYVVIQLKPTIGVEVNVTGTTTVEIDILYRPDVTLSPDNNPYRVIENTTNLHFTCIVKDANPLLTSFRWYKDNVEVSTEATYIISTIYRSHTGNYSCDATNTVGSSDPSSVVHLDVLYGVSLKLSGADININESESWEIECIGDGNPLPQMTFVNRDNNTLVGTQTANVTSVSVNNANCVDTGVYVCSGNNTIGEPRSQPANIKVACTPRTYNNVDKQDIYINGTDESLNITTTFISFPLSRILWYRELSSGNLTDLGSEFISFTIPSLLPYETKSILQKDKLSQNEFGNYLVKASNIHGSFLVQYNVIPKREPDPPTNISAICDVTSIRVTWISRFNGGENQTFRIHFTTNELQKPLSKGDITDTGRDEIINGEKKSLSPETLYWISVEAENVFGSTKSEDIVNCTTKKNQVTEKQLSSALVGGITGSISAFLIVMIVVGGLYIWRRRRNPGGDNDLIKSCSKETDEEDDGLKENPLYITSGEASNADGGPVYGIVNKQKQKRETLRFEKNNDQGQVYSQVQKSNAQGTRKQKGRTVKKKEKKDNRADIELAGTVYENSDELLNHNSFDELYANAEDQRTTVHLGKEYLPKKNKDGLIYADLDLIPGPIGGKFVIRGIENRTNYAMIDLSIKVDPLPSDSEDENNDNTNVNSTENN